VVGVTYSFKVEAHNSEGYSAYSTPVSILAAEVPDTPSIPSTTVLESNVIIAWTAPDSNGSPISSYIIEIRDHSGNYHLETVNCNGSTAAVWQAATCTVPLSVLIASPFSL
jgi:hypothetical protein